MPNSTPGYQFISEVMVADHSCVVLLDTGAAFNAIAEETLVRLIRWCERHGIEPGSKEYPVVQLEKWSRSEEADGIAKESPVALVGAAVLQVNFRKQNG